MINLLVSDEIVEEPTMRIRIFNNARQQLSQQVGYEVKFSGEIQALMEKPRLHAFNPFRGDRYRSMGTVLAGMVD